MRCQTMSRKVDDVPAVPVLQNFLQGFARDAVLQNAQLDGAILLAECADATAQLIALVAKIQRIGIDRQTEDRKHTKAVTHRKVPDLRRFTLYFEHKGDILHSQGLTLDVAEF